LAQIGAEPYERSERRGGCRNGMHHTALCNHIVLAAIKVFGPGFLAHKHCTIYPAQPRAKTPPSGSFFVLILAHAAQSSVPLKTQPFDNESHFESVALQGSSLTLRHKGYRDQIGPFGLSPKVATGR